MLKALLAKQYGFPRWPVRPPLDEASPESVTKAMEEIMVVRT
jgi:hypothetical protein